MPASFDLVSLDEELVVSPSGVQRRMLFTRGRRRTRLAGSARLALAAERDGHWPAYAPCLVRPDRFLGMVATDWAWTRAKKLERELGEDVCRFLVVQFDSTRTFPPTQGADSRTTRCAARQLRGDEHTHCQYRSAQEISEKGAAERRQKDGGAS